MDILSTFFHMNSQGGQLDDLFLTVLNMSVTGALVICVVLLLRLALKRAPKQYSYWLWSAAGFRLLCPVSWRSVFSIFSLAPAGSVAVEAGGSAVPVSSMASIPADIGLMPQPKVTLPVPQLSNAVNRVLPAADPLSSVNPMQVMLYVGALVWLAGVAAMLIWGGVSYARLCRRLRTAVRLEGNVWQSEAVGSPFLLGFLRPRIYLPYGLEGERLAYVLAHERFHIARRDYLVKLLAFLILCLHWFNPLVWLAFSRMGRDMEMRCDEAVLGRTGGSRAYSETLLSFAVGGRFPSPGPLAFGESGVKARIRNALRWRKPRVWVTVTALLLVAAGIVACTANPAGPEETETPAQTQAEQTGTPWDWTSTVTAAGLAGTYNDRTEATPETRPIYDLELLELCDALRAVPQEAIYPGRGYPSQKWVTLTDGTALWTLRFGGDCVVLGFDDETAKQWPIDPENPAPSWEIHDQALLDCLDRMALNKLGVVVWLTDIRDGDYVVRRDGYGSFRVPMLPMDSTREPQIGDRLHIGYTGDLPEPGGRMDESSVYSLSIFHESEAPATTAPPFADELRAEIIEDWKTHQPTDANRPGSVYRYFDSWAEATAWAGWTPDNPLEDESGWLEKKNTAGTDVVLRGETDHAAVHARGDAEGNCLGLSLSAGYACVWEDVRVQFRANWGVSVVGIHDGVTWVWGDSPAASSEDEGERYLARELRYDRGGAGYTIRLISLGKDREALDAAWLRLLGVYAEPVGALNGAETTAPRMTVTSGGVTVAPYEMLRYEKLWSDEHGSWINGDGIPLAAALEEAEAIPTLTLAEDFELTYAEGVSKRAYPKVYDTDFRLLEECAPAGTAQLFLLEPGEYYVVFPVYGPVGRYIAAEDAYEESGWDCLIRLRVERQLARPWTPGARPLSEGVVARLGDVTRTDWEGVGQLARLLEGAEETAPTGCPFGSVLWLTRSNNEVLAVCPAEDGCGVFWSGGKYYRYAEDGAALWALFDPETSPAGLPGLNEGDAFRLSLAGAGSAASGQTARNAANSIRSPWNVSNARYFFFYLNAIRWSESDVQAQVTQRSNEEYEVRLPIDAFAPAVSLDTENWTLTAYAGMDAVLWVDHGDSSRGRWLLPDPVQEGEQLVYELLRGWYDEAEFAALRQEIVIPNRGQGPAEAAQAWCQQEAEQSLKASTGSRFRDSFVKTLVTARDTQPGDGGYESGKQWRFLLKLIFVPENERAERYKMAGNTMDYTGDDPEVPEGAYICTRMGYVVLEPDGWHGVITGTG